MSFIPSLGIFRSGAHPGWLDTKYYIPIDEDHDNSLDKDDLAHMVAEFFDVQHNQCETNLLDYDRGEDSAILPAMPMATTAMMKVAKPRLTS